MRPARPPRASSRRPRRSVRRPIGCAPRSTTFWRKFARRSRALPRPLPRARRRGYPAGMRFRIATLNLEQDHKRWALRRGLIGDGIAVLKPDLMALNEVCVPLRTAHALRDDAAARLPVDYALVQQTR